MNNELCQKHVTYLNIEIMFPVANQTNNKECAECKRLIKSCLNIYWPGYGLEMCILKYYKYDFMVHLAVVVDRRHFQPQP